jgi:hypothetical protein
MPENHLRTAAGTYIRAESRHSRFGRIADLRCAPTNARYRRIEIACVFQKNRTPEKMCSGRLLLRQSARSLDSCRDLAAPEVWLSGIPKRIGQIFCPNFAGLEDFLPFSSQQSESWEYAFSARQIVETA